MFKFLWLLSLVVVVEVRSRLFFKTGASSGRIQACFVFCP